MLDTSHPHRYEYLTKHIQIYILGGLKPTKLESMRVTLSIQKVKATNVLRHTIDLYNDNQLEKFTRKVAERLEIGTSIVRKTLQELTRELENHRFLVLDKQTESNQPFIKELTAREEQEAIIPIVESTVTKDFTLKPIKIQDIENVEVRAKKTNPGREIN